MTQTLRRGDSSDPFIKIQNESYVIFNNYIILKEKPYKNDHITISGYCETISPTPDSNMFVVDYPNGVLIFNPSENGKTVLVNYTGIGKNFLADAANLDVTMGNNTRTYKTSYINNQLTQYQELDANNNVVTQTDITYNTDGTANTFTETINGVRYLNTINYTNGEIDPITPITRSVI